MLSKQPIRKVHKALKSDTAFFSFSLSIGFSKIIDCMSSSTIALESPAQKPRPDKLDIGQTSNIKNKQRKSIYW